ncbi:hypothetical protein LXL04_022752 [Taraxacum kok-saghyz]
MAVIKRIYHLKLCLVTPDHVTQKEAEDDFIVAPQVRRDANQKIQVLIMDNRKGKVLEDYGVLPSLMVRIFSTYLTSIHKS